MKRNLAPVRTLAREVVPIVGSFAPANGSLPYDAQSGNFTVGLVLTGGTSGATGLIEADTDGGATGTLKLSGVVGRFRDNEAITDSSTGAAVANGALDADNYTLRQDGQTANFAVNEVVTGAHSGATGVVVAQTDAGAAGDLVLSNVKGVFIDNEVLTGNVAGVAVVNGVLNAPANPPTALKGEGFTVAWVSAGLWKVTLGAGLASIEFASVKAMLQAVAADDKMVQVGSTSASARTMEIRVWDKSAAAVLDLLADANTRIHFVIWTRSTAAALNKG